MRGPFTTRILALHALMLMLLSGAPGTAARAATSAEETLFQSTDLRIYRTVNRNGVPIVVLTNVDAEGRYFPGRPVEDPARDGRTIPPRPSVPAPAPVAPERPPAPPVKVVVNGGDGEAAADSHDVEVSTESGGGTTVIINIHQPDPAPRETVVIPVAYPSVAYGTLAGPYRYPDHLYFLGYSPGTSSPSYFGGLGLNAGNRFGLKGGAACDQGYDCLFGPTSTHP